jgi:hypothetical protein
VGIWHEEFREPGVNENCAEDQAANPNDDAAVVEWCGLKH